MRLGKSDVRELLITFVVIDSIIGLGVYWLLTHFGLNPITVLLSLVPAFYIFATLWIGPKLIREARDFESKKRVSKLEAEAGIPLLLEGKCKKCDHDLVAGAKFCSICGAATEPPAPVLCENCGARQPERSVFCYECGRGLKRSVTR